MDTDREDSHLKTEARGWNYTTTSQRMPRISSNHQKLQRGKEGFLERLEGAWHCQHVDFCLLVSKTVSKYISVVLSHLVNGSMLVTEALGN